MLFHIEEKPSNSPLVDRVWRAQGLHPGRFISQARAYSEIVLTRYQGRTAITVRGPETKATFLDYESPGAEYLGITFKLGAFIPLLPPEGLLDWQTADLPAAGSRSFWLKGSAWQYPDFENVDTFITRLVRGGLLMADPLVDAVLDGRPQPLSPRAAQYRFKHATGLSSRTVHQITRARTALALLEEGVPILDAVFEAGYADQPHLTRSLKRYFGQTPAQIAIAGRAG